MGSPGAQSRRGPKPNHHIRDMPGTATTRYCDGLVPHTGFREQRPTRSTLVPVGQSDRGGTPGTAEIRVQVRTQDHSRIEATRLGTVVRRQDFTNRRDGPAGGHEKRPRTAGSGRAGDTWPSFGLPLALIAFRTSDRTLA